MIRYLRLYKQCLEFSFAKAMQFRVDFAFRIVMDCAFYAVNIAFFAVVHDHTNLIAGWDEHDTFIFVCSYLWLDAVQMTFFSNNLWWFPQHVNKGDLDYYLVRPVSTLFFVSLREFAANSFVNLIIAQALLSYAIWGHPDDFGLLHGLGFLALLCVGSILRWGIQMLFLIPVFWVHRGDALRQMSMSLEVFGERPHRIYPDWLQRILTSVIPFALIASYPTAILVDGPSLELLGTFFGVTVTLLAVMGFFWRRGLRAYSSASS